MAKEKNFARGPRIRSGGQTGVDRAALDAAVLMGRPYEGWCPKGGWAEDFLRPPGLLTIYPHLMETPSESPEQRTEWNVRDSDATLVLWPGTFDKLDLGTRYAIDCALRYKKYLLICDPTEQHQVNKAIDWIIRNNIETLNVSGPSEGTSPGVGALAERFIRELLYAC